MFFIELGLIGNSVQLHVNYYVKYNTLNKEEIISSIDFITLLAEIGYYFSVDKIVIYSEYRPCFIFNQIVKSDDNEANENTDELIGNLGDVHLYKNHTLQAIQQISRKPHALPTDRKSTRLNSSHVSESRMPSSA